MKQQGWIELTAVQVGGAICLPVLMVGQLLGEQWGLGPSLLAIALGNCLLVLLGWGFASMAAYYRQNTMEIAYRFTGSRGGVLFSLSMLCLKLGWFAIQLNVMSLGLASLMATIGGVKLPHYLLNLGLGLLITLCSVGGIKSIARLALWSMPLLVITMVVAAFSVTASTHEMQEGRVVGGLSVVIAAAIGAVFNLPTYFCHAKSRKEARISVLIVFALALPLIELLGVRIGLHTPGLNIVDGLTATGGIFWQTWVLAFLLFAGWTTNNTNLYTAAVSLRLNWPALTEARSHLLLGCIGTVVSLFPLLHHFPLVLNLMGTSVAAAGTAILVGYIVSRQEECKMATLVAWAIGSIVGFASIGNLITIAHSPLLDAALGSAALALIANLVNRRRRVCRS